VAVEYTLLTNAADEVDAATFTTASVSPATGDLLFVSTAAFDGAGAGTVFPPTSITWNGNNLTKIISHKEVSDYNSVSIWYYQVATGASATVVINWSDTHNNCAWTVGKVTGHDSASPIRDSDLSIGGGGSDPTITMTSVSGDLSLDCGYFSFAGAGDVDPANGQTVISEEVLLGDPTLMATGKLAVTGTSVTVGYTGGFSSTYGMVACVIKQGGPSANAHLDRTASLHPLLIAC
jgi:hypothetical protein